MTSHQQRKGLQLRGTSTRMSTLQTHSPAAPRPALREAAADPAAAQCGAARRSQLPRSGWHRFPALLLQTARFPSTRWRLSPRLLYQHGEPHRNWPRTQPPAPPALRYRLRQRLSPPPGWCGLRWRRALHYPGCPTLEALFPRSAPIFLSTYLPSPPLARACVGRGRAGSAAQRERERRGGAGAGRPAQETKPLGRALLGLAETVGSGPMAAAEAAAAPAEAALDPSGLSPKEEGELEDGEISDDDNNGFRPCSGGGSEPGSGLVSSRPYSRRRPPPGLRGGISVCSSGRPFSRSRHQPPPDMGHMHGHGGYRPKDSFRSHPPPMPAPRIPSGSHSEAGPRLSFWERSHNALDRFRFRGRPYRGGGRWGRSRGGSDRGGNSPGRPPGGGGGSGFSSSQGWREPSPRKCILET